MSENPNKIEQEISELEKALAEKKAVLEKEKGEVMPEKEVLREVIKEKIKEKPSTSQVSSDQSRTTLPETPDVESPSYLSDELKPKIQEFVNMAFNDSLEKAISTVKATKNPALIDAFHDIIVDELYNFLVERGKLKKVS